MLELAERLEGAGSFNIEAVISPLKSMISTAIMEYHGSSKAVSEQVSQFLPVVSLTSAMAVSNFLFCTHCRYSQPIAVVRHEFLVGRSGL